MFEVKSTFIGNFKLGDNINRNLLSITLLYTYYQNEDEEKKSLLRKPITLVLISIIEALLYDLHYRIRTFTREGVRGIPKQIISLIRGNQFDELTNYIASAKKHNLFDKGDSAFYDSLDELRKLRNRIHIQNIKNHFETDEYDAFSEARMRQSEVALEKIAKTLAAKYNRSDAYGYVAPFLFPWSEHFPDFTPINPT